MASRRGGRLMVDSAPARNGVRRPELGVDDGQGDGRDAAATSVDRRARAGNRRTQGPFVTAVALLGISALLSTMVASLLQVRQVKERLPLRRPLDQIDTGALHPYRVVRQVDLDAAVVDALGTHEYLNWVVEDLGVEADSPVRFSGVLVTYYSGGRDMVPHTPDVCYLGAGYQPLESRSVDLPDSFTALAGLNGGAGGSIPVRMVSFAKTSIHDRQKQTVAYTFRCNDRFVADRTSVRLLLTDVRHRFAYFSKVEVSFPVGDMEMGTRAADRLFSRLLPLLVRDHWPDFERAERDARMGGGKEAAQNSSRREVDFQGPVPRQERGVRHGITERSGHRISPKGLSPESSKTWPEKG